MSIGDIHSAHFEEEEPLQNPFTQKENKPQNLVKGAVASVKKGQGQRIKHPLPHTQGEKPVGASIWDKAVEEVKKAQEDPVIQKLEKVQYIDAQQVASKLEKGDILLSYYPRASHDTIATAISQSQKVSKTITGQSTAKSHKIVHAAMYVDDGELSEAVGGGIRINRLDGERFTLNPGHKHSFVVVRPKNAALAQEAAKIAKEVATADKSQKATHQYSLANALGSAFNADNSLTKDSVKRYLKGWAYIETGITPVDKNGIRAFFCSHFIGWACQAGESKEVMKKINNGLGEISKIVPPKHDPSRSLEEYGNILDDWAQKIVDQHYDRIQGQIRIRIDPKLTTPQHLYLFFLENPDAFEFKMRIVAPEKEIEMKEMKSKG